MAKERLAPGTYGEPSTYLVRKNETGLWRTASGAKRRGDKYRAVLYYRGHDGDDGSKSLMRDRKGDAIDAVVKAVEDLMREVEYFGPSTPFVAVGKLWLEGIDRDTDQLAASSRRDYRYAFEACLDAGGSGLQGLTLAQANDPQRVRKALQLIADERGEGQAKKCKTVLSNIFQFSVDSGVLNFNATRSIRKVKAKEPKPKIWQTDRSFTDAEVLALMAHVDRPTEPSKPRKNAAKGSVPVVSQRTKRTNEAVADLLAFLLGTGARVGEACSLKWTDLDWDTGKLLIHKSKTNAGERRIDLNPSLLARMLDRAERTGGVGSIFPSPTNPASEWDQSNRDGLLRSALDSVGLDWAKSHTCRHTVITKLAENGVPLRRIADMVGHESVEQTMAYLGKDFGSDKSEISALLVYSK